MSTWWNERFPFLAFRVSSLGFMLEVETTELIVSATVGTNSYIKLMFYLYYFNSTLIRLFSTYSKILITY